MVLVKMNKTLKFSNFSVLSQDEFFSLTGKITKAKEEYQNPTSIRVGWFQFIDGRNWTHCGGESILSNQWYLFRLLLFHSVLCFCANVLLIPAHSRSQS